MPLRPYMPDSPSLPGYPEGQHNLPTNFIDMNSNVLQLFDRVDCLEKLVCSLQEQLHTQEFKSSAQRTCQFVNATTQTDSHDFSNPTMDFETLSERIRHCQCKDRDISTLKYFIVNNIIPESKEISNFQPKMRRYLWHLPRFVVQDNIVYRKKMDSDRITETLQLLVPSSLVSDVLQTLHPSVGHVSSQRTLEITSQNLFWPFMLRDIHNFTSTCQLCQNSTNVSPNSSIAQQTPSSVIQKAVCAITELTKEFINCSKSQNFEPSAKCKRSRRSRQRVHRTPQPTPQSSSMNSFSSPEDQLHHSPPRCQPCPSLQKRHPHSPPKDTSNHSPQSHYFNQQIQPSPHRYHNRSQPTNYRNHPPPSESSRHHRYHARDLSSHSPPSDIRDAIYEPLMDLHHHSPRGYNKYSPPRDSHSYHDIPRHHSPYRDDRYF